MKIANKDIRLEANEAGVRLWWIADQIGLSDANFSRKLRYELPNEEKEKLRAIIRDLSTDRGCL